MSQMSTVSSHSIGGGLLRSAPCLVASSAMYAALSARSSRSRRARSAARVRRRFGIIIPRLVGWAVGVAVLGSSAVVVSQAGKNSRLPGRVL